jgi:hypothetical protein
MMAWLDAAGTTVHRAHAGHAVCGSGILRNGNIAADSGLRGVRLAKFRDYGNYWRSCSRP